MATTLKSSIGEFKGVKGNGVTQYLGIKYANLKDQLAVPEMVKNYGGEIVDATKFGPRAVAFDGCQFEQDVLIQQRIDTPEAPPMSALNCLNLNITVPDVAQKQGIPVMVFIHGGGFVMGANWWPQYDQLRLVKLSVESGMPVIAVNINYRLGVLGNLTSEELRKAGYPGNNGVRDQNCALQWVKTHIGAFGGDSDNVTVFGESAGAVSVLNQLFSKIPLFRRAISMSGTPLMLKPLSLPVTEMTYGMIMKELGLENASVAERIEKLKSISEEELAAKTPLTAPLIPFLDGDIIPTVTTFADLENESWPAPGREWCSELVIGDCQHDGSVFAYMGLNERKAGIAASFCASLMKNISNPAVSETILQAYDINPSTPDDEAFKTILEYSTDIAYYAPALAFAQSWPGKTYYYHFNEPNPFDGPFRGQATHTLDATYLFQNYNEKLSPESRDVAISLATEFIKFANGAAPWQEYQKEQGGVRTFGSTNTRGSGFVERNGWNNGRRATLFELKEKSKINIDELSVAWDKFLAGQ